MTKRDPEPEPTTDDEELAEWVALLVEDGLMGGEDEQPAVS